MAKYDITYSCGHTVERQLFGPMADRKRRMEAAAKDVCPACWKAAEEAQGPILHAYFRATLAGRPGGFALALEHAFPVRAALKAVGYRWDPDATDMDGSLDGVFGGRGKPVWRRDYPLTTAGYEAWLAEAARLEAEGIVRMSRVKRQEIAAADIEIAIHQAAQRIAAEREAADAKAATTAASEGDKPGGQAAPVASAHREKPPPPPKPLHIEVTPGDDGCTVRFPRDDGRNRRFRAAFPKARWLSDAGAWHIPGARAASRAEIWGNEEVAADLAARKKREDERVEALFEGREAPAEGADYVTALLAEGRKMSTRHIVVAYPNDKEIAVTFAYNASAVDRAKRRGGRWDAQRRCWIYPLSAARKVHAIIDEIEAILSRGKA